MTEVLLEVLKKHLQPYISQLWDSAFLWRTLFLLVLGATILMILFRKRIFEQFLYKIPTQTIKILEQQRFESHNIYWWSFVVGNDGSQWMHLGAELLVTNVSNRPISLTSTKIKNPETPGLISVRERNAPDYTQRNVESFYIPVEDTVEVDLTFEIQQPIKKRGEIFTADISITDHFGNEHWKRGIIFKHQ